METDANDVIFVRIGQTHKFPITTPLRALNAFDHRLGETQRPQKRPPIRFIGSLAPFGWSKTPPSRTLISFDAAR